MGEIRTWKIGETGEPEFPADFKVTKKAVLQITDIVTNRNKYYAIELHEGKGAYRVYTHYGRTDDLETNPNAGMREARYCNNIMEAGALYDLIYRQKTSVRKGYKEVNLASSKIGSSQSVGKSSGVIDDKTLSKLARKDKTDKPVKVEKQTISADVAEIVKYLYSEAVNALTSSVNVSITANGIETPLGVLTLGQIDSGQAVLDQLATAVTKKSKNAVDELIRLSGEFYTLVPHRIGRTRDAIKSSIITTPSQVNAKQDTLQLMRDMLNVNGKTNVLVSNEVEKKYKALNCSIEIVSADEFKKVKKYVEGSQLGKGIKVKRIYRVSRPDENHAVVNKFHADIGNAKQLFHGSSVQNWVGILSRGILMPKKVVALGGSRTDGGWLGNGIYFGDAICTSINYAGSGSRDTSFVAVACVALGKIKKYSKITYGLNKAPDGYHSCHGVRDTDFDDDEFVVYNQRQQKLQYLVECES